MNLQSAYSLEVAEREAKEQTERDVHPLNAVA
jgi:plasmid maintenance system antidote protein VapI